MNFNYVLYDYIRLDNIYYEKENLIILKLDVNSFKKC